ncbi:MAG TPA: hypothetical protein ENI63_01615 [Candidatus Kaiserbacteria bacterium]|nr:hypothetical protein [Candidatus Kaiserbacteria bacterium]
MNKKIIILYHAKCFDGFGAAWAAYKKFGDTAEYIPVGNRFTPPSGLDGKEVYIVDFSYPKETLLDIQKRAKKLIIIDHHKSAKDDVESVANHIFDNNHSGAVLTWNYLHTNLPVPTLLKHIEDGDLWNFALPHTKDVIQVLGLMPFEFHAWDIFAKQLEDESVYNKIIKKGAIFKEHWDGLVNQIAEGAQEVEFEGYKVYAINASRIFRSSLGHILAIKKPPFAIVWYHRNDHTLSFSLRGDGSIDLAELAKKYGGGGHHDAASFEVSNSVQLPFKLL